MQLAEGLPYPNKCSTNKPNIPLRDITITALRDNTTTYRLIRMANPNSNTNMFRLSCRKSPRFLYLKGMSLLLLGQTCQLRDATGNLISGSWGDTPPSSLKEGFALIYNEDLFVNNHYATMDNAHNGILAIMTLAIALLYIHITKMCCTKNKRDS